MPPGWFSQVRLLLSKNFLLKWRAKLSSLLEIAIPLVILLMLSMFRSVTEITTTQENLLVDEAAVLGDGQVLGTMLYAAACGAKDVKGARTTDPTSFAIAAADETIQNKMANHIKTTMLGLVSIANVSSIECSSEPVICRLQNNKGAVQCKGPFQTTQVLCLFHICVA